MAVYERLIVGTDGSQTATRAVQKAALLAGRLASGLVVTTCYSRPDEDDWAPASERSERRDSLGHLAYQGASDIAGDAAGLARPHAGGVDVSTVVREGDPADVLIEVAAAREPSLLVVGSKGMTGSARFLLGSVPNKVSHHAASDVLISRTDMDPRRELPRRMMIATDGSKTASRALDRGLDIACAVGAEVTVLFVGFTSKGEPVLDDARERAARMKVDFTALQRNGDPSEQIVADGNDFNLVVVGNKGMTGPGRFLLGSVPNKVSHHIATDLCIVKTVG